MDQTYPTPIMHIKNIGNFTFGPVLLTSERDLNGSIWCCGMPRAARAATAYKEADVILPFLPSVATGSMGVACMPCKIIKMG